MAVEDLVLVGRPQDAVYSSSTAVAVRKPSPLPVADVNGYYAALGVPPGATRHELFAAYRDLGTNDAWTTFVFQQLRDPVVRAAYDAVPAGGMFPDQYVLSEIQRRAHLAASRFRAAGHPMTAADIISSLGIEFPNSGPLQGRSRLDTEDSQGFDGRRPSPNQTRPPGTESWRYAYFRKATTCDDVTRLAAWQEEIAITLAGCESVPTFSVGFHHATSEPYLVEQVDGIPVFLLHVEMESSPGLIRTAIATAVLS